MSDTADRQPYVGPRPFEREDGHLFFGRDREADEVVSLIIAHRVVLLYAQSGAGKTSLVNAGVLPRLEEEGFEVLPLARVRGLIPEEIQPQEITNLYVLNALLSWAGQAVDPRRLTRVFLSDYLREREHVIGGDGLPSPRVVIFDQLEELFTFYSERWEDREVFFGQLGKALEEDPLLRVVLVLREDYLAQMDPYASLLPEGLATRFRLEPLGEVAALQAAKGPLRDTNRTWAEGVAESLVENLLRIRVQVRPGKTVDVVGQFVEPVYLQVVCECLWRDLPPEVSVIEHTHLQAFGDVDQALVRFYEGSVKTAVQQSGVSEAKLRPWFNTALITPARTRGTAFRSSKKTGGIPNAAVDALERLHVIRGEWRAGSRWYELNHDRFIDPIIHSNELHGQRVTRRRFRFMGVGAILVVAILATLAGLGVFTPGSRTEESPIYLHASRTTIYKGDEFAGTGYYYGEAHDPLGTVDYGDGSGEQSLPAERPESGAVEFPLSHTYSDEGDYVVTFTVESDGESYSDEVDILVGGAIDLSGRFEGDGSVLSGHLDDVNAVAFSEDGESIATASDDGLAAVWDVNDPTEDPFVLRAHEGLVWAVAFSSDGSWLATAGHDVVARLWYAATGREVARLRHDESVMDVAFSPDGAYVATASADDSARLWDMRRLGTEPLSLMGHEDWVRDIAFSPDGKHVATASDDATARIWDMMSGHEVARMKHQDGVNHVAFSEDGAYLATASDDGTARVWQGPRWRQIERVNHADCVADVAFSPDGRWLATASEDHTGQLWDANEPDAEPRVLRGHEDWVRAVAFSPDSRWLATASDDGTARLWDIADPAEEPIVLRGHEDHVLAVTFSPDGRWLATASEDNTARLWDVAALTSDSVSL